MRRADRENNSELARLRGLPKRRGRPPKPRPGPGDSPSQMRLSDGFAPADGASPTGLVHAGDETAAVIEMNCIFEKIIAAMRNVKDSEPFIAPVNLKQYPTYTQVLKQMGLYTHSIFIIPVILNTPS